MALARHRPVSSSSALPLNRCCGSRCSPSAAGAVALRAAAVAAAAAVGSNGGSQSAAAACCPCASGTPAHVAARDSPWQAQLRPAARRGSSRARVEICAAGGASRGSTVLYPLVSSTIIQHTVLIFPVGGAIQQVLYGVFAKSHTSQEGWKEGESERH